MKADLICPILPHLCACQGPPGRDVEATRWADPAGPWMLPVEILTWTQDDGWIGELVGRDSWVDGSGIGWMEGCKDGVG